MTVKDRVFDALMNSPVAREAEAQHVKAITAQRNALAAERAALEKTAVADYHAHEKAVTATFAEHEAAAAALRAAKAKMGSLQGARAAENHIFNVRVSDIEVALRETADPAIGAFIDELRAAHDVALKTRAADFSETIKNPATGKVQTKPGPPRVLPADRAQAVRDTIAAAEALKLEADQTGVAEKLAQLRAALPVIGELK